jgi:hypothetical protein
VNARLSGIMRRGRVVISKSFSDLGVFLVQVQEEELDSCRAAGERGPG